MFSGVFSKLQQRPFCVKKDFKPFQILLRARFSLEYNGSTFQDFVLLYKNIKILKHSSRVSNLNQIIHIYLRFYVEFSVVPWYSVRSRSY